MQRHDAAYGRADARSVQRRAFLARLELEMARPSVAAGLLGDCLAAARELEAAGQAALPPAEVAELSDLHGRALWALGRCTALARLARPLRLPA